MSTSLSFVDGREFEKYVFGIDYERVKGYRPSDYGLMPSIALVIRENWQRFAESLEGRCVWHDPSNPSLGQTKILWEAVRRHLPKRVLGRSNPKLNLYISVGVNSLDWVHGADALFWWQGAWATVDASLRDKKKLGILKANFLLLPEDFEPKRLDVWSYEVAQLLKERSRDLRFEERRNKKREKVGEFFNEV